MLIIGCRIDFIKLSMIRSVFSALGMLIRLLLALVLIAGVVFVAFVAYRGSQPMQIANADGMTYWQFVR
jgi:hypothetical protein